MAFPTIAVTPGAGATINTLPNAGQQAMANSLPVVIASDQTAVPVGGSAAQGATVSGNPAYIGVEARTTNKSVSTGQAVGAVGTLAGAIVVYPWSIPDLTWNYAAGASGIVNTTTAVTIKAAGAAGIHNYLNTIIVAHDTLGAVTELAIRDGASGTVIFRTKLQTTANEGQTFTFEPPLRGTSATLMEVVTLTGVTGGVYVNAFGFQGP
jgi:hypothetical protein